MYILNRSPRIFLLLFLAAFGCAASSSAQTNAALPTKKEKFLVEKVLRSDAILLENNTKVRLIGLKGLEAPRRVDAERDEYGFVVQKPSLTKTLEDRAFEFVSRLLTGKYVYLEFDAEKKDASYYTLAYVFLADDNTFVNAEILRQGYASLSLTPPNLKYQDQLRAAYREAREERRGIHEE